MDFWLSVSLFFGGALSYWAIANLLTLGHCYAFVKHLTDQMVLLLISVSQDASFLKSLKYDTMKEMNVPDDQIEVVKRIDKEAFGAWKDVTYVKLVQLYPKHLKKILKDYNWDIVTKSMDDLYK